MKSILCASFLMLFLGILAPQAATAQSSADGDISFSSEDSLKKSLGFSALGSGDGSARGRMLLSGPAEIPDQDVDGTGKGGFSGKIEDLQVAVDFDQMVVAGKNRAVMRGTVTGSTLGDYVGQRVLLTVEDNGESIVDKTPDNFTWGIYKPAQISWIPSDAEIQGDDGWRMTWWATDYERRDDVGYQTTRNTDIEAQTFPTSSYNFVDVVEGAGNITVQP